MPDDVTTVTLLLERANRGEPAATEELVPLLYDELRNLAKWLLNKGPPAQTLQPTALVHEAFLRLVGGSKQAWEHQEHFFNAAAQAMRQILVDQARRKAALKRGGDRQRVGEASTEPRIEPEIEPPSDDVIALHEALEELEKTDEDKARIAALYAFAGLTLAEIATVLGVSLSTVERQWRFTKLLLYSRVRGKPLI